jgi:glycine cleavage system H protein
MSNIPGSLRYTQTHEWVRLEADGKITMGLTDYAQHQMGEIVMVDSSGMGRDVRKGEAIGALEAVKTAEDFYAPLDGKVVEVNKELEANPGLVNTDCYGAGWLAKIAPANPAQYSDLLTPEQYLKLAGE